MVVRQPLQVFERRHAESATERDIAPIGPLLDPDGHVITTFNVATDAGVIELE